MAVHPECDRRVSVAQPRADRHHVETCGDGLGRAEVAKGVNVCREIGRGRLRASRRRHDLSRWHGPEPRDLLPEQLRVVDDTLHRLRSPERLLAVSRRDHDSHLLLLVPVDRGVGAHDLDKLLSYLLEHLVAEFHDR